MSSKFTNRILPHDPQAKILYEQFRNKLTGGKNDLLKDPEYLALLRLYLSSLDVYTMAIREAAVIFARQNEELPGPRRKIDFYKLERTRRFYERDAFRYFTYRQGFNTPLPPQTSKRIAKGYLKDAACAQFFNNIKRANSKLVKAQKEVESLFLKIWKHYKDSSTEGRLSLRGELGEALELAQSSGLDSEIFYEAMVEAGKWKTK